MVKLFIFEYILKNIKSILICIINEVLNNFKHLMSAINVKKHFFYQQCKETFNLTACLKIITT